MFGELEEPTVGFVISKKKEDSNNNEIQATSHKTRVK